MIGFVRPLCRYQAPSASRKRTGEVETLLAAVGRSLPRGDRPRPITLIPGSTAFSASYAAARNLPALAPETLRPRASNCGRRNAGWLGSFMTTYCFTVG